MEIGNKRKTCFSSFFLTYTQSVRAKKEKTKLASTAALRDLGQVVSSVRTVRGRLRVPRGANSVLGDVVPVLDSLSVKAFEAGEPGNGGAEAGAMRACVFREVLPHAPMSVS